MDLTMPGLYLAVGLLGGSLTILAELIRGGLGIAIECFAFAVMRRVHRGTLGELDDGTGKLEQVPNLAIGAGLLGGAIWIAARAVAMVSGEREIGTPFGLAAAAIVGGVIFYVNLLAWDAMRRAARTGGSLIMGAQLSARTVKLLSSLFVAATLTVAAISADPAVVAWADAAGSLFVAYYLAINALGILRDGIPDLLDRTAGEEVRAPITRALARHYDDYARLDRVRSRRSGDAVFIEIALGFDLALTMAEVDRRIAAMKASIRREIAKAEVSILAAADTEPG